MYYYGRMRLQLLGRPFLACSLLLTFILGGNLVFPQTPGVILPPEELLAKMPERASTGFEALALTRAGQLVAFQDLLGKAALDGGDIEGLLRDHLSTVDVLNRAARAILSGLSQDLGREAIEWWNQIDLPDHLDQQRILSPLANWFNLGAALLETDFDADLALFASLYREWEYFGLPSYGFALWESLVPLRIALGKNPELRERLQSGIPEFNFYLDHVERSFLSLQESSLLERFRSLPEDSYPDPLGFQLDPRVWDLYQDQAERNAANLLQSSQRQSDESYFWGLVSMLQSRPGLTLLSTHQDQGPIEGLVEILSRSVIDVGLRMNSFWRGPTQADLRSWLEDGVIIMELPVEEALVYYRALYSDLYRQDTAPDDLELLNLICQWGILPLVEGRMSFGAIRDYYLPVLAQRADPFDQIVLAEKLLLAFQKTAVQALALESSAQYWTSQQAVRLSQSIGYIEELRTGRKSPASVLPRVLSLWGVEEGIAELLELLSQRESPALQGSEE